MKNNFYIEGKIPNKNTYNTAAQTRVTNMLINRGDENFFVIPKRKNGTAKTRKTAIRINGLREFVA